MIRKHEGIYSDVFKPNKGAKVSELKDTIKILNISLKESTEQCSQLIIDKLKLESEIIELKSLLETVLKENIASSELRDFYRNKLK